MSRREADAFYVELTLADKALAKARKALERAEDKGGLDRLGKAWASFHEAQERYKKLFALL